MMNTNTVRRLLSRFNKQAFFAFVLELFSADDSTEVIESLADYDRRYHAVELGNESEGIFCHPLLDSYGGSIHRIYILHYLPIDLLPRPSEFDLNDPYLQKRLEIVRSRYKNRIGQFGMVSPSLVEANALNSLGLVTNLSGFDGADYKTHLLPRFMDELERLELAPDTALIGSYDSFFELNSSRALAAFDRFLSLHRDGLRINLADNGLSVSSFMTERSLDGLLKGMIHPHEPVYLTPLPQETPAIAEFQEMLQKEVSESKLEFFLAANYREIFGAKYDRIEAQIWLRFPELDIAGRSRRLDLFLRNSVTNDWELFELKKSKISLTGTYRDVPILAAEIHHAAQQLKNYGQLLKQRNVQKSLASEGIEYYEPELNLVVGRTPNIPHGQWRWLQKGISDIKIMTYDDVLAEMKLRADDLDRALQG